MPEHPPATERDVANALFIRRVRIAAYISLLVWVLAMVALFTGWFDPRVDSRWKLPVQTALLFSTPLLFVVLPALVLSYQGGLRTAKIAVALLIIALIVFVALIAQPLVGPLFR